MRMPLSPGQTLRLVRDATRAMWSLVEREALAVDLDLAAAAQGDEDLLLAVLGVVVLGVALVVRRHVDDLHAEGLDPELGAGPLEGAAEDGLHLVDLLDRVVAHPASFRFGGPGWAGWRHPFVLWISKARLPPAPALSRRCATG